MERSTMYGCHFIDQTLSSFILRIDPPELPTHARWWIHAADVVRWRKRFLPKLWGCFKFSSFTELVQLWGCFKFSSFTELVQRLLTCWLLFRPFDIFEGRVGLFLYGRTPCAITRPDMSIWNVSRVLTLYQTFPFLACITAFFFSNFLGVRVRQ